MSIGELPHQEERKPNHRHDRQRDDLAGMEPVEILALVEHDLQRDDPDDEQREADGVDRQPDGSGFPPAIDHPGHGSGGEANGHVDIEDPRPGNVVGDPPAE